MKNRYGRLLSAFIVLILFAVLLAGCSLAVEEPETVEVELPEMEDSEEPVESPESPEEVTELEEDGYYSTPDEVALFLHTYNRLPDNYITKSEASKMGWDSQKGNLWDVTDKMIIGGDRFGNREKLLPEKEGRIYYECDVNYEGGYRGSERLVFSNDGLIFYTKDHYESFEQLY